MPVTIPTLVERLRAATAVLQAVAEDWSLLDQLPAEDRKRLHQAVAGVYHPDPVSRRQRMKAAERERIKSQINQDDALLNATGIRSCVPGRSSRRRTCFRPKASWPRTATTTSAPRESIEPQHCYVCKQKYSLIHHFYDQLCPGLRGIQFRQAQRTGRPARACRPADRRTRQDRLSGRPETAACRRRVDRDDTFPARFGRALCTGARFRRVGPSSARSSASTCAIRRASRHSATSC